MEFSFVNLFWLFLILSSVSPMIRQRMIEAQRTRAIRRMESRRNSRVITLIHRQESVSFLGIPVARYIDIHDSEQILRAINLTPPDWPIDLILHTPGGLVLATEQIAHGLINRPGRVTVFVPHYAMSGGTLLALAADEVIMDRNAVLGPVDPQIGNYAAADILKVVETKPIKEIEDQTLILAEVARKALKQVRKLVIRLTTANGMAAEQAERIADAISSGQWTHDYPIDIEEAKQLGLPVHDDMPPEVYELMNLFPQPAGRRPTVQYIPMPYGDRPDRDRGGGNGSA